MEDTTTTSAVVDAPAPISTPSAPSVDGSVSTPATSPAARPTSMKDALERTAARHADNGDAATIVPPANADPTAPKGPIPFLVHETALKNARDKTRAEALAEYDQQYGWAKQVNQQDFQQVQSIARHFKPGGDPIEGLQNLMAEIRKDPANDARLRSLAARALSQRSTSQTQAPDFNPREIQLEDGSIYSGYSADQVQAFVAQEVGKVKQEFQPLIKAHETTQAERQIEAQNQYVTQVVDATYKDAASWAGMSLENQVAVAQRMQKLVPEDATVEQVQRALDRAYREVVVPQLLTQGSVAERASLKQKAVAQVESPSGAAAPAQNRPKNPQELAKFMEQRANARRG